jgi:5-methylcytosine-specific restriction endonuclease McrBC regulatory subunit McrC
VSFLQRVLGGNLEIRAEGSIIRRVAGHAVLPSGAVLRVRSKKTNARSILTWLTYCDPTLEPLKRLILADEMGEHGELAALTSALFVREVLRAARQHGLARSYACRPMSSSVVRGRIDFARQIRARGDRPTISCLVWERTPETLINRWLATALHVISCDALMRTANGPELLRLHALLDGIALLGRTEQSSGPPKPPRHLLHLEPALALASLLVRHAYLDEGSSSPGASFFNNLEALFERTVVRAFYEAGINARPKHPTRFREDGPSGYAARSMQIDLYCPTLCGGVVIDAKYKTEISAGNLQQMVTYCHLTGAPHAVLVFPEGHLQGQSRFTFVAPDGRTCVVDVVELRTDAARLEDWRTFGRSLVADVLRKVEGTLADPSKATLGGPR